ncbi:MAG: hypothetical protein U0234_27640 [Sandaracinus sp.]
MQISPPTPRAYTKGEASRRAKSARDCVSSHAEESMTDWKLALVVGGVALGGVVVGAQCFGARPVAAQTSTTYTRCIVARQESLDTRDDSSIEAPDPGHTVTVPSGWEVVGGGGLSDRGNYVGAIVLCHR